MTRTRTLLILVALILLLGGTWFSLRPRLSSGPRLSLQPAGGGALVFESDEERYLYAWICPGGNVVACASIKLDRDTWLILFVNSPWSRPQDRMPFFQCVHVPTR